jgi:hypothetical protein
MSYVLLDNNFINSAQQEHLYSLCLDSGKLISRLLKNDFSEK